MDRSTVEPDTPVDAAADQGDVETGEANDTPEGYDALGDPGKRALDAMKAERNDLRARLREAEARLAELDKPAPTPDLDRLREEIRAEVQRTAHERVKRAEVRAAATGLFADPEDALVFVPLDEIEVDDDGNVDGDALRSKLEEILKRKPHLAAPRTEAVAFDTGRGRDRSTPQITREQLKQMTPAEIVEAKNAGRLDQLLGRQ